MKISERIMKCRELSRQEFRERAVDLVLTSGLSLGKVAPDLGIGVSALDRWVRQGKIDRGIETRSLLPPSDLHAENVALRRELRKTREELEIVKRAAALFVRENILPK